VKVPVEHLSFGVNAMEIMILDRHGRWALLSHYIDLVFNLGDQVAACLDVEDLILLLALRLICIHWGWNLHICTICHMSTLRICNLLENVVLYRVYSTSLHHFVGWRVLAELSLSFSWLCSYHSRPLLVSFRNSFFT
jgi:hypothetical protein